MKKGSQGGASTGEISCITTILSSEQINSTANCHRPSPVEPSKATSENNRQRRVGILYNWYRGTKSRVARCLSVRSVLRIEQGNLTHEIRDNDT